MSDQDKNNQNGNDEKKNIKDEIKELEKLIDEVRKKQKEAKNKKNKPPKKPKRRMIKINLASKYSNNFFIHLLTSFLINFILLYGASKLVDTIVMKTDYVILFLAIVFTAFEETIRHYILKKHLPLVIYSSGLIFYLCNVVFFYVADLVLFMDYFDFRHYWYPPIFTAIFQIGRFLFKTVYIYLLRKIGQSKKH